MKLNTAALILEWADGVHLTPEVWERPGYYKAARYASELADDTATAEYLAYCVRVTELVEAEAETGFGSAKRDHAAQAILAEASQKAGK